jgi:hypothetical protein
MPVSAFYFKFGYTVYSNNSSIMQLHWKNINIYITHVCYIFVDINSFFFILNIHGGSFMKKIIIPAEIYSRVSGYFRPVSQWNYGKQEEFSERKMLGFENTDKTAYSLKDHCK